MTDANAAVNTDTYDYIVVGAGSAGAAAAARLSEDGCYTVALLEAGPPDTQMWTRPPLGVGQVLGKGINLRHFFTEPEAHLHQRSIYWPRGWVVGGSSTVNGMIWVHGTPHLFDEWAADGCPGWSYADVLPWFRKIEDFQGGDPQYRGQGGPVTVTEFAPVDPLADAFLDSVQRSGVGRRVRDYNVGGIGGSRLQFNTRNGIRCNTRMAYLDPARGRSNLTLITSAMAQRVLIENQRAVGVQAQVGGRAVTLKARREVVLCGGAFNSPQLLELSGVGSRDVLQRAGIPVVHELPMVGENLSEHVYSPLAFRAKPGVSWNRMLSSPLGQARMGLRWLLRRDGPMSTNTVTAQAFVPTGTDAERADLKIQVQQVSTANNRGKGALKADDFDGVTIASFQIRPYSRGSCHIRDANPAGDPTLIARHFDDSRDVDACLQALKMARQIAASQPLAGLLDSEFRPGPGAQDDEALIDYLRATGATAYHPVGTCRIGTDARQSVVDPQLRVHGIAGLRVADGSVMPTIAATNTNAICIVIGERVANWMLAA